MMRTVIDGHPHVDHRAAGQFAFLHGLDDTLFDRRDETARNDAADDLVDELETLAAGQRFDLEPAVAVLAAAAGLFLVLALCLAPPCGWSPDRARGAA